MQIVKCAVICSGLRTYKDLVLSSCSAVIFEDSIGFGNEYRLSESGDLNGYEQNGTSGKLGRLDNSSENERLTRVDGVGQIQSEKSDTPHSRRIHRSGVSAETLTSSGLTAEQTALRAQDEFDGFRAEFYTEAKNVVFKRLMFLTQNTLPTILIRCLNEMVYLLKTELHRK